jgi:hypothetical protein
MNAEDWQAAAEVLGVVLVLANILGGMFIYRMQASFVTRNEHRNMGVRVDGVEANVTRIDKTISGLFTNQDAEQLKDKMGMLATQNATLLGELPGLKAAINQFNHQLNLLIQNELNQAGKR